MIDILQISMYNSIGVRMAIKRLDKTLIGKKLKESVFDDHGLLLLSHGVKLTEEIIVFLNHHRIEHVYVCDEDERRGKGIDFCYIDEDPQRPYIDCILKLRDIYRNLKLGKTVLSQEIDDIVEPVYEEVFNNEVVMQTLHSLKAYSDDLYEHSVKVSMFAGLLAKWANLKESEIKNCIIAGLIHDIGKTNIPESILFKKGKLTRDEMRIIKEHPYFSYVLARPIYSDNQAVLDAIRNHHERYDGSGYPRGLKDQEIDELSRIIAVSDLFVAMTSEATYRDSYNPFETFHNMTKEKLDKYYFKLFVDKTSSFYLNLNVKLTDGTTAEIIHINKEAPGSPVVFHSNIYIDLSIERNIRIESIMD